MIFIQEVHRIRQRRPRRLLRRWFRSDPAAFVAVTLMLVVVVAALAWAAGL
jgi:hypothetical protein